ncbi:MAG: rod shape-determining protein MreD [Ignavibacteriaceae bacterium]|nr:rod shape-determining protein MreD [Ignavibacteriaceae bacterium]
MINITFLKTIVIGLILVIIQIIAIPFISVENILPFLPILPLVYFTLLNGQIFGTVSGAIIGLIFDIASGGLLGGGVLALSTAGFITGYFYSENKIDINTRSFWFIVYLFIATFIFSFLYASLSANNPSVAFLSLIFFEGLLPAFYTSIIGALFYLFISKRD